MVRKHAMGVVTKCSPRSLLAEICRQRPRNCVVFIFYILIFSAFPLTVWFTFGQNQETSNYIHAVDEALHFRYVKFSSQVNIDSIQNQSVVSSKLVGIKDYPETSKQPVILMWSKYYDRDINDLNYTGKIKDPNCCEGVDVTFNRSRLEEATAVVINHWINDLNSSDLPVTRSQEQLWVLYSKESSCRTPSLEDFDGLFNLTMTYRHDSDIFSPYGYTEKLETPLKPNEDIIVNNTKLSDWIKGKTKLFAVVVSHCWLTPSRREYAAKLIKKDLDIYGACGIPVCQRNASLDECNPDEIFDKIAREYKFYFAAENSLSQDYITEKFWRTLLSGVVPVVYGGGNYSAVAPPNSYIDSRNFKSPKDLVKFLKKVGNDAKEYEKYFQWRKNFTVYDTDAWQGWCDLCKYIQQYTRSLNLKFQEPKILNNLNKWWSSTPFVKNKVAKASCFKSFWKL